MEKFSLDKNAPQKSEASNEKSGKKISRRDFLKKGAAATAAVLAGGALKACDSIIGGPSDEELAKMDKKKAEERRRNIEGEPDIMGEHLKNRYVGYTDLEHFLGDYPWIKKGSDEYQEAENYFNNRDGK